MKLASKEEHAQEKMTKAWWQSPVLQVLALALIAVVVTALVLTPQKSVDPRSDASEGGILTNIQIPTLVWPTLTPMTIGNVPNGAVLPSGYLPMVVQDPWLTLTRPLSVPYATYPVFVTPTPWNPSTVARAYGWSSVPCNQSNFFLSLNRLTQDPNTLRWSYSSNQEISMGGVNQVGSDPSAPEFCIPDPKRPGMYAFRLIGVNGPDAGELTLNGTALIVFGANGANAKLTVAKVAVNGPSESWPPTALTCGDPCSEQSGYRCASGLVCKLNPGQLTKGVCVVPDCSQQNCTCTAPPKP